MKQFLPYALLLSLIAPLANSAYAQDAYARIDGNWNSDVWSTSASNPVTPGLRPTDGGAVRFGTNGVDIILDTALSGTFSTVQFRNLGTTAATLTLNAGAVINSTALNNATEGGTSSVTINSGAIWNVGATGIRVANSVNSNGTITVNGGQLLSAGVFSIAGATSMTGTLNFYGGTIQSTTLQKGAGASTANFLWTGGTLITGATNLSTINNSGTGNLAVGGVNTIGTFVLIEGATTTYTQGANASLTLDIASSSSFDRIATGLGTALTLDLNGTIEINLLAGYTPTVGETFDVITATSIVDSSFVLGGNGASLFTSEIVDLGGTNVLRLTAVPEPSVIGLGLLGGAGLLGATLRRRFRNAAAK